VLLLTNYVVAALEVLLEFLQLSILNGYTLPCSKCAGNPNLLRRVAAFRGLVVLEWISNLVSAATLIWYYQVRGQLTPT
jgi:hypothetical protein